jgi:hypothetical protein
MKYFNFLIGTTLILSSCSDSNSDIKNLALYGSRFSEESLAERNLTQTALSILAEEKASLTNDDENKKAFLEKAINKLVQIETKAEGIYNFIFEKESELLKSADLKGDLGNVKGITNFSKNNKDITFNFIELELKDQNSVDISLSDIEKKINEFKVSAETNFKDDNLTFIEFLRKQNKSYSFKASEYESSSNVLENLILLEEIEFGFNKYYHSIIEEYKSQFVRKLNGEFGFGKIQEVFIPESKVVGPGEEFTAKVMLVSSNDDFNKISVTVDQGEIISIQNGIATIKYKAPKSGAMELTGTIAFKNNNGVLYKKPFSEKVSVKKLN